MAGKSKTFQEHVHKAIRAPHQKHSGQPHFDGRTPHHSRTPGPAGSMHGPGNPPQQMRGTMGMDAPNAPAGDLNFGSEE